MQLVHNSKPKYSRKCLVIDAEAFFDLSVLIRCETEEIERQFKSIAEGYYEGNVDLHPDQEIVKKICAQLHERKIDKCPISILPTLVQLLFEQSSPEYQAAFTRKYESVWSACLFVDRKPRLRIAPLFESLSRLDMRHTIMRDDLRAEGKTAPDLDISYLVKDNSIEDLRIDMVRELVRTSIHKATELPGAPCNIPELHNGYKTLGGFTYKPISKSGTLFVTNNSSLAKAFSDKFNFNAVVIPDSGRESAHKAITEVRSFLYGRNWANRV